MARIYTLHTADVSDPGAAEAVLDAEERDRAARFVFPEHQRLFTLAHGMLRVVLGRALGKDPRDLQFEVGSHGKPSVEGIAFNLSHTNGMVAVAVGPSALGVDVEDHTRKTDVLGVCDRFFSAREVRDLRALPPERQQERFFRYWTLKEAYIKARGLGLAIPLGDFGFYWEGDEIRLFTEPRLQDAPSRWRFHQTALGPYFLALCTAADDTETEVAPFRFHE